MGNLPIGPHKRLITDRSNMDLTATPDVMLVSLDPADAHDALTRHIADLAGRELRTAGRSGTAAVTRQEDVVNRTVDTMSAMLPRSTEQDDVVTDPARHLMVVASPSGVPGVSSLPRRPAVPLPITASLINRRSRTRIAMRSLARWPRPTIPTN
jgi:hypothetical protein